MRVVVVAKTFGRGGAARGARNLVGALEAVGLEVVAIEGESVGGWGVWPVRLLERGLERTLFGPEVHCLKMAPANVSLTRVVRDMSPDVIQLCDISGNTVPLGELGELGVPMVHRLSDLWPYGGPFHYGLAQPRSLRDKLAVGIWRVVGLRGARRPDALVAPSHWLYRKVRGLLGEGIDMTMIRNATPAPKGAAAVSRGRLARDHIRLGFIAPKVLDPRKGFARLVALLKGSGACLDPSVSLEVFGKIREGAEVECGEVPIRYHGAFDHSMTGAVFRQFDVLMCPSKRDNSPNVVCEAMASGVPVIGQRGTGMEDYVKPARAGLLVDYGDQTSNNAVRLREAVTAVVGSYREYSAAGVRYVREELEPKVIGAEYMALYDRLLRRARRG